MTGRINSRKLAILDHFPIRCFVAALIINSLFLFILGWSSWQLYREWQDSAVKIVHLQELIGVIQTTDEVLTMSAMMAAATGDLSWEDRYLSYEPKLDKAIRDAMKILPDKRLSDSISKTDAANLALVEMEKESFALVHQHQTLKAAELLFSDQYRNQKDIYTKGTTEALAYIGSYIDSILNTQKKRALFSFLSVVVIFLVTFAAWIRVLHLTGEYLIRQNRIEEKLRKSRGFLDSIIENLPVVVFIKDAGDLRFIRSNKAGEDLLGYSQEELLNKTDYDLFPEQEADSFTAKDRAVLNSGTLLDIPEETVQTRLKGERILHTRKIPILDKDGRPEYLLGISEDITERKNAEREIKKIEEERIKAQKIESIGTLAGGIAHDFNNLLQGIFGYIALARQVQDDRDDCGRMLEEAEKALHLAVNLTNQLLTFSKGGKPLIKSISILPILEDAVRFALSGSRLNYHIDVEQGLWKINADGNQISQVIQNIVLNADQATSSGGDIKIHVQNAEQPHRDLQKNLADGKYLEISITDTGTGIPEEDLHRIFDPYFTTKAAGSGLGLATSYSIIRNHNGAISVKSEMGKGTMFRIFLPAFIEEQKDRQRKTAPADSKKQGRILIMDDDELILDCAEKAIETLGHLIETARNGDEAVKAYREAQERGTPFDIVILDLTIRGGMGGLETIRPLLALDADVTAVVSSGYSDDADIVSYKQQGFKAVLKKPYTMSELRNTLNQLLNIHSPE